MISFNSIGHFFAKAFLALKNDEPKIAADLNKVEGSETTVETVTALAGGASLVPVEKAAYAVLGAVSGALLASEGAAAKKLADAGLDTVAIQAVEDLLKKFPALVAVAKAL